MDDLFEVPSSTTQRLDHHAERSIGNLPRNSVVRALKPLSNMSGCEASHTGIKKYCNLLLQHHTL